jgi:pimeloyl-ACP methyl ester carboxylesterase
MATMQGVIPGVHSERAPFKVRWSLVASIVSISVMALLLWSRPFWFIDRVTDARLSLAGMHNEDVVVGGHNIHYLVGGTQNGNEDPILLVHGLGSRASDWAGLIPPLVHSGRRVYAIDLLGYGKSDRPADAPYSIPEEAQVVEGFLKAEHLQRVDLAGWSMGGWISMVVAIDMPQNVSRLVLLDSAGVRFQPTFDPLLFTPTDVDQLHQLEHLLSPNMPVMPSFVAKAFLERARPDAWVIRRSVNSMLTGQDLVDNRLSELKMPVLIVWGKQDMLTPLALAYEIHAAVPNSQLQVFDGCGHLAPGLCARQIAPSMVNFLDHSTPQENQQHAALEPVRTY